MLAFLYSGLLQLSVTILESGRIRSQESASKVLHSTGDGVMSGLLVDLCDPISIVGVAVLLLVVD
jgi:hypothetical protein